MSKISFTPNASGTGTFTIASPNSNTNRTLTLPDADGALLAGAQAPFIPATVSGATQALDVGTYNFFDGGTLAVDTTLSFSSVPAQARWTYTTTADVTSAPWDITDLTYTRRFSVATEGSFPQGLSFKTDGTEMYVVMQAQTDVVQYSLSTAWDISTSSYTRTFSIATEETDPKDVFFKTDGTAMYIIGQTGVGVDEYSLSTAWDISTASWVRFFSVSAQETAPSDLFFKPDGTVMYVIGTAGDSVHEYSLSTAWNISTASFVRSFSVGTQESGPQGLFFKPDGLKMYVVGTTGDDVNEYSLSTAWNISTASFVRNTSVAAEDTQPQSLFFKPDGTKLYIMGDTGNDVNEYAVGALNSITLPASVQNSPIEALTPEAQVSYTFFTADAGTTVKLINEEVL